MPFFRKEFLDSFVVDAVVLVSAVSAQCMYMAVF